MPEAANSAAGDLLTALLRDVSRSFYLTLRVLPAAVRKQIGLAYLLARATDTIADTEVIPVAERLQTLKDLRARILGESVARLELATISEHQGSVGERVLLQRIEEALAIPESFDQGDRQLIREVLATITSGQTLDLERFGGATNNQIVALQTDAELDDYTYRVAGCVGEFWTKICLAHLGPTRAETSALIADGIRFGKGLQLVNILRDISADLRIGRCYLPQPELRAVGLLPSDLLAPTAHKKLRPLFDRYLNRAEEHLDAGWRYTNSLPFGWVRLRLACAWPILIGLRTIALLRRANFLESEKRVKVSRAEVKKLMIASVVAYPLRARWEKLPLRAREV